MKKLTDQELDSIFKNAAEGHQPAYDPSAWDAMAKRLDQPVKKIGWNKWMTYLLLGSMIFLGGIWVGTNLTDSGNEPQQTQIETNNKASDTNQELRVESQVEQEKFMTPSAENENTKVGTNSHENRVRHSGLASLNRPTQIISDRVQTTTNANTHEEVIIISDAVESLKNETNHELDNEVSLKELDSVWVREGVQKEQVPDSVLAEDSVRVKREAKDVKPVFMRALVSPDFSSINFATTNSMGTNYSLLVEYPLTKRLFISSGAILSTKVYSSSNEIVYGKYTADGVEGTCQILDIPINVYYLFNTPGKFSFFAGAGASSYFMMSEEYTFYINTNSGKREFDWSFKGENIDWFKMLNISVGVQYKMSNKFYLQAEPFVKVPLAGIGEWDIDLSSVGVFMGLKYRLNK